MEMLRSTRRWFMYGLYDATSQKMAASSNFFILDRWMFGLPNFPLSQRPRQFLVLRFPTRCVVWDMALLQHSRGASRFALLRWTPRPSCSVQLRTAARDGRGKCYRYDPGPEVRSSEAEHCVAARVRFLCGTFHPIFSFFLYAFR
jgi:hypothetical protein